MTSFDPTAADTWADDLRGPVALHLRETLQPVEGPGAVIFPPTYAKETRGNEVPYAIDKMKSGKEVVQIDSVGSQANRIEPLFKRAPEGMVENPLASLIPQIDVRIDGDYSVSLLEVGHRLGDALVRSSDLRADAENAFKAFLTFGDAGPIAKLAPTSLIFGAWDSRGDQAKMPRIVQSVIRGWDVDVLHRSAQYNPPIDYSKLEVFSAEEGAKAAGNNKSPLAQRGFVHVPAVDTHGGIVANGGIFRDVTINLVALRQLGAGKDTAAGISLRRYILGLALVAATEPQDGFLRAGCLLTPDPEASRAWTVVARNGTRTEIDLAPDAVLAYARTRATTFGVGSDRVVAFNKQNAKDDLPTAKAVKAKG